MADQRTERRENRRAFRPTMDGTLETRVLMAHTSLIRAQTAAGGQAVVVTNTDGAKFFVSITGGGTVRATPASQGRVNLFVDGSSSDSMLEVNRILPRRNTGRAHTFVSSVGANMPRLNIASITVSSGTIGAIEGYQTAVLSGAVNITGSTRVDRIALYSILPGGSITTSGDVNTLDIYSDVTLSGTGAGISIGRDLNWFQTFGNVNITDNANFTVGRDLGNTLQPAKGSGNAGQGTYIKGNLNIDPGSALVINRFAPPVGAGGFLVIGSATGASRIFVSGVTLLDPAAGFYFPTFGFLGGGSI